MFIREYSHKKYNFRTSIMSVSIKAMFQYIRSLIHKIDSDNSYNQ